MATVSANAQIPLTRTIVKWTFSASLADGRFDVS